MAMARTNTSTGVIDASGAYPRATFIRLCGMTRSAFGAARKNGLRVRLCGKRVFVLGKDWIEFLDGPECDEKCSQETTPGKAPPGGTIQDP